MVSEKEIAKKANGTKKRHRINWPSSNDLIAGKENIGKSKLLKLLSQWHPSEANSQPTAF